MTDDGPAVTFEGVTKRYGNVTAVRDVWLSVERGTVYGLVGPNGSGKSTLVNVLLDYVTPTAGTASIFGRDVEREDRSVRRNVGVVPDSYAVYDALTGREHLDFVARTRGVDDDPSALLDRVGLADAGDRRAGNYSTGMAKRLLLAMALVGDPDLLVFDEPFRGLDPAAVATIRAAIETERAAGTTVLLSSHLFDEVAALCDEAGVLRDGELVNEVPTERLRAVTGHGTVSVTLADASDRVLDGLGDREGVLAVESNGSAATVTCDGGVPDAVLAAVADDGGTVTAVETEERRRADAFAAVGGDGT